MPIPNHADAVLAAAGTAVRGRDDFGLFLSEHDLRVEFIAAAVCRLSVDGHPVPQSGAAADADPQPTVNRLTMPAVQHGTMKWLFNHDRCRSCCE